MCRRARCTRANASFTGHHSNGRKKFSNHQTRPDGTTLSDDQHSGCPARWRRLKTVLTSTPCRFESTLTTQHAAGYANGTISRFRWQPSQISITLDAANRTNRRRTQGMQGQYRSLERVRDVSALLLSQVLTAVEPGGWCVDRTRTRMCLPLYDSTCRQARPIGLERLPRCFRNGAAHPEIYHHGSSRRTEPYVSRTRRQPFDRTWGGVSKRWPPPRWIGRARDLPESGAVFGSGEHLERLRKSCSALSERNRGRRCRRLGFGCARAPSLSE